MRNRGYFCYNIDMSKSNHTIKSFIKDLAERCVKTFAQSLVAAIGTTSVALGDVDWGLALSTAGLATLLSVLTSIASMNIGDKNTASMV